MGHVATSKDTVLSWEDWFVGEQFSKDASNRPDINWTEGMDKSGPQHQMVQAVYTLTGFEVGLWVEHDLWSSVPPCGNILSECSLMVMSGVRYPGPTKVTDLQRSEGWGTELQ